jgi:hypothetical protein
MIYTQVARKGPAGVPSPLDLLDELTADDVQAAVHATARLIGSACARVGVSALRAESPAQTPR